MTEEQMAELTKFAGECASDKRPGMKGELTEDQKSQLTSAKDLYIVPDPATNSTTLKIRREIKAGQTLYTVNANRRGFVKTVDRNMVVLTVKSAGFHAGNQAKIKIDKHTIVMDNATDSGGRGLQIAIINGKNGKIEFARVFDTYKSS